MSTRPIKLLGQLSTGLKIPANSSRTGMKTVGLGMRLIISIRVTGPCTVRVLEKKIDIAGRNVVYRGDVMQEGVSAVMQTFVQNVEDMVIDIATGELPAVLNSLSLVEAAPRA